MRRRVNRRQFDAGGDQTSCRRSRDAAKNMYTTRRATIGHFFHHSGHGRCDDGPSIRPASSFDLKSSKRVLSSGDYFYFCNRKNKLVGGRIHILWIDYDPKSILKFLVFWDTERQTMGQCDTFHKVMRISVFSITVLVTHCRDRGER